MPNASDHDNSAAVSAHLDNVAENLQLIADLGYGDVALAVPTHAGTLRVIADARPMTAVAAVVTSRMGQILRHEDEPEAYEALERGETVRGDRRRLTRGISFVTMAYPIGTGERPEAVVVRNVSQQVLEAPGTMETAFMTAAEELLSALRMAPLRDAATGRPFSTLRRAGDGVIRVSMDRAVTYASPNAVNIMGLASVEAPLIGRSMSRLPGSANAVGPVIGTHDALATEVQARDRILHYRAIGLSDGAFVLVEDVTDARRREQELKVKEATIREVHHRVKNNLQTIASLLRIQARRAETDEARRSLAEAMERVASMAVVHELLAGSTEESIDFKEAAVTVVDMVRRSLSGEELGVQVNVKGGTGEVPAPVATSLALVVAELVHNAIEHGLAGSSDGVVDVEMRRLDGELVLTVRDNGVGLPAGFDLDASQNLGLAIVRTIVEDDLQGTLSFSSARGTTVTVRFPLTEHDTPKADR